MNVNPYRRSYFALCKRLGIDDELRHDVNFGFTGKFSTREFSVDDWRQVVAELQRRAGQDVEPSRPRIRTREEDLADDDTISAGQLEYLSALASEIPWTVGVTDWIRARMLSALRRANWNGELETLFAAEASRVITALRHWRARIRRPA